MSDGTSLFQIFDQYPSVVTLLSKKTDGDMRSQGNREKYLSRNNISYEDVVTARLVHGNNITAVSVADKGHDVLGTDGIIADQRSIFLTITVADCLPIYLYDPKKEAVGLLHAGWKGLEHEIIPKGVSLLKDQFEVDSRNLVVGIGPGIGVCHFEVQDDLLIKFSSFQDAVELREDRRFLDLKKIAQMQLLENNVAEKNIETSQICTYCEKDMYFSHRRDQIHPIPTMLAGIGVR